MKLLRVKITFKFTFFVFLSLCVSNYVYCDEPEIKITSERVEFLKLEGKTIFTNNVKMTYGQDSMLAGRMVKDDKNKIVQAEDNVKVFYESLDGQTVNIFGNKAHYDLSKEKIHLPERPYLVYTDSSTGSSGEITSDNVTFYKSDNKIIFDGDVKVDKFQFRMEDNKYLSRFNADMVTLYLNDKKILFKQNVHARIEEID